MAVSKLALVGALGLAAAAGSAQASISFTFDDPSENREEVYTAPAFVGDTGHLTYLSQFPVELVVNAINEGAAQAVTFDAKFVKNVDVGAVTDLGGGTYSASITGTFEYLTNDISEDLILGGTFTGALIFIISDVGTIVASDSVGDLVYTAGQEMIDRLLSDANYVFPGFDPLGGRDAAWTLTDLTGISLVSSGDDDFFGDFSASAAYTGTADVIPTPGSIALMGLAGLGVISRRRSR